jgi:triacylglycerol lipase
MEKWLKTGGFRPLGVNLKPSDGSVGLDKLADQIGIFAEQNLSSMEQFDLVGFSMGGIVARYYVQRLGGIKRVRRLITIAAPHHGTYVAYAAGTVGSKQMRPGSSFLRALNSDAALLEQVRVTSIWTPFDLMIAPASNSRLGLGQEFRIPVGMHPWMLTSQRVLRLVEKLLRN